MEKLTRQDILGILGCDSDPKHSLQWYTNNYPDLKNRIEKLIQEDIQKSKIFPKEANKLSISKRCIKYSEIIVMNDENEFNILKHDTDHALILEEIKFNTLKEASDFYINNSYCTGGAISAFI